jgi:hypothetical protein
MSPISEEYRLVLSLKPKLLAIRDAANGTVSAYLAHPSLFALRIFVKQINKDLIDLRDTFAIISHLLYGNTTERITASLVEMTTFSFHILSQRDKFRWIDTHPIQPTDIDTIITSLRNISSMIDTNALIIIDTFAQSIERRDNPRAYNLSRSSSRSSSYSSSSRSSSSSSSSSMSRHSSPSTPPPPPRQPVTPLNLGALSTPNNRLPLPLVRQNARIDLLEAPIPLSRLSSNSSLDLSDARGKKYRKTKVKRRIIMKATHRKPLATNNSRKYRRAKTRTKKNN